MSRCEQPRLPQLIRRVLATAAVVAALATALHEGWQSHRAVAQRPTPGYAQPLTFQAARLALAAELIPPGEPLVYVHSRTDNEAEDLARRFLTQFALAPLPVFVDTLPDHVNWGIVDVRNRAELEQWLSERPFEVHQMIHDGFAVVVRSRP